MPIYRRSLSKNRYTVKSCTAESRSKKYNILRESHISLSWFPCRFSILVELKFGDVGFCGGRKTGEPGEKPSEQGENQQQTQWHRAGIQPGPH